MSEGQPLPFWISFDLSAHTMMYMVALTVVAAAVIGALPAWKATGPRVQGRLQALTAGGGGGMHLGRVWTALILVQVAFAVALLPMVVVRMSELAGDGNGSIRIRGRRVPRGATFNGAGVQEHRPAPRTL